VHGHVHVFAIRLHETLERWRSQKRYTMRINQNNQEMAEEKAY
jgi:hypothetical protein